MSEDYSDLLYDPIEKLASESYCDLAAFELLKLYEKALLYRITDTGDERFAHIFLMVGDKALDIEGFCDLKEMVGRYFEIDGAHAVPTTQAEVMREFLAHGRTQDEQRIVKDRFRQHVKAEIEKYRLRP